MPSYTQALSLNMEIILAGDLNFDMLPEKSKNEGKALFLSCSSVNGPKLIFKPARVIKTSKRLLNVTAV